MFYYVPQMNELLLHPNKATKSQVDYILILVNEVGLGDSSRYLPTLRDWVRKKKLDAVGDLTKFEASICIGKLKEIKENANSSS
jgi:hypothetical protein